MSKEYTRNEMLRWLEEHFREDGYEVTPYSDDFLPARVPLHCKKEEHLFNWGKVPGDNTKRFQNFLIEKFGIKWVKNADINKIEDDKIIIVSDGKNSVEVKLNEKEDKIEFKIDGIRTYDLMVKDENDELNIYNKTDEMIIEITTDKVISKDSFFPLLPVGGTEVMIAEASPVRFFQYYFPNAKVFFAYPDYVDENDEFNEFKKVCIKRGIGLLKTSKKIEEMAKPRTLFDEICNKIANNKKKHWDIEKEIGDYLENYLHYLVYYPAPEYKRRAIIGRMPGMISYVLIDKLLELKNVIYSEELKKLASEYRTEWRDDYDIAIKYFGDLWKDRLGLRYPEIQRHLEEILLRDEMYREHFVHQFQVFLIGVYILDRLYDTKGFSKAIETFEKNYDCKIEDAWLAASTYHDFNYGLQNFDYWLLRFFRDTLSINDEEAKKNLNILNLDAAMVREFLSDILGKMIGILKLEEEAKNKARKFFYEKVVRDRNHGLLSALSILKLCKIQKSDLKVSFDGILQAAFAIACHDEDMWEALCGCKGYLRSNSKCEDKCDRKLSNNKEVEVHKQNISSPREKRCEIWEEELMKEEIIQKIKFNKNPILFLLIYCDSIQEEGRITSMSFDKSAISKKKEFKIKIKDSMFNDWIISEKKLGKFEKANEIENAFITNDYELSNEARIYKFEEKIYKLTDLKWKIVDEKLVYEIEKEENDKTSRIVRVRKKECSLSKINVGPGKVKIDLIIDGLDSKRKELERVSWALEDKRFKVHLKEKDTEKREDVTINGSGGG